jgi:alkanesulfonate monooxygenase SsuD/methylene tetrahydromethanopterin reductase-like flavin-dependent oxidoreductase (luciferase family)|tara:strand:- start:2092 stop:3189 length:1098 start_codon:yes stop_codon:yes gene_type:complete
MLNLGLFMMPLHPANKDLGTSYEENRQLVLLAEKLGYTEAWMGEHYSSTGEPVTSPLIFNASLISETKNIKFGTGVISLPQQHPAVVAGQVSLFDHLSKGRLILGVGAGGLVSDWELFDNMDGRSRAITMIESVEAILKFWSEEESYNYTGEFLDISLTKNIVSELGIGKFIKPYQNPHPEIAVSLKNPNSMTATLAGEKGWIPISGNFVDAKDIATHWPTYKEGANKAGKKVTSEKWRVGRSVLVTNNSSEAEEIINDPNGVFSHYFLYLNTVGKLASGVLAKDIKLKDELPAAIEKAKDLIIIGDEKTVTEKLIHFIDTVGPFGTLLLTGHDMTNKNKLWEKSFTTISDSIKPILSNYIDQKF